ncbi:MAG: hypothetical protein A2W93_12365 [Bacteroidetes bacterium GWF2_43_63]|nr:MAG: hypothetical protein A2W94_06950 [Bacteroidetes bacterium GWE2_42_42]OFY56460.1 MAG: hypothetical protein A2W93_12365 [Bacteroidetes bacterium GWF2_43_63]HBG71195.1 hypothetical protein [Bacteroidales bacterium]HCB61278.1 hypothetical protein [Bacteroidales bacterium]HCY23295.1 hypothetical protein [Bacteroidales bacterium]
MKKGLLTILIFIAAFVLFLSTYDLRSEQKQQYESYDLTPDEYAMLKDGDLILRHGYGLVSDAIANSMNEENHVSHVAVLVKSDTASHGFRIIHCVSQSLSPWDGVQEQTFPRFIRDSQRNSIMVVRFKDANDSTRSRISEKALDYMSQRVTFDHAFDIADSSTFYCSELPWMIFKNEFGVDIFKDKMNEQQDHMKFSNFWNPDNFEVIINHNTKR